MHFGIANFLPSIIYYIGIIVALLSIFYKPKIGIFFLFPLLPYQNIFERIKLFPFGKDLNDIIFICILIGWLMKKGGSSSPGQNNQKSQRKNILSVPIALFIFVSTIGVINSIINYGFGSNLDSNFFINWKNYMLFPLIWFLVTNNIKDKKNIKYLTIFLIIGLLGADYYFRNNLRWMNVWHYSDKSRDMMTGLFVYLGANHYGAFFAHYIFILIGLFLFVKSKLKKLILLLIISLTFYCIMYTFSRGAYIALLAGLLFIGLVKEKKILILLFFLFISWRSLAPVSVVERINMTKTEDGELESSAAERLVLWQKALDIFSQSPVIGNGFCTFQITVGRDTHNFYFKTLAELGILGFISLLYLFFASFRIGWKLFKESQDWFYKGLGLGFAACVISVMITNAFGDRWSYLSLGSYFWIFLGLVTSAWLNEKREISKKSLLKH